MLAVKDQRLGLHSPQTILGSGQRMGLEAYVLPASLKQHDRANRKRHRHACQQALDSIVVPHPTALEVGELELAVVGLREQVLQRSLSAVKTGVDHECTPLLPVISANPCTISCSNLRMSRSISSNGLGGS